MGSGAEEVEEGDALPARRSKRARKEKTNFDDSPERPVPVRAGVGSGGSGRDKETRKEKGVNSSSSFAHSNHISPFSTPTRAGDAAAPARPMAALAKAEAVQQKHEEEEEEDATPAIAPGSAAATLKETAAATVTAQPKEVGEEMSARERREWRRAQAAERARELRARGRKLSPVSRPLGMDRDGKVYVLFRGDPGAVYVGALPEGALGRAVRRGRGRPPTCSGTSGANDRDKEKEKEKDNGEGEAGDDAHGGWSVFRGDSIEGLVSAFFFWSLGF